MQILKILYVQVVIAALALCVVWQAREVRQAGYVLEELRQEGDRRAAEIQIYRTHIGKLRSPQRIVRLADSLGLELAPPTTRQDEDTERTEAHDPPPTTAGRAETSDQAD